MMARHKSAVATGLLCLVLLLAGRPALAATYRHVTESFALIDPATHTDIVWTRAPGPPANACSGASAPIDDDISQEIPLGFSFRFGTVAYTSVRVMSNGRLQFNNSFCGYGTQRVGPPRRYPYDYPYFRLQRTLRVFGADWDPSAGGTVRYARLGSAPNREFVVTWSAVPEWNAPGSAMTAQVILRENGEFLFQYGNMNYTTGGLPQIGWELGTGDFDTISYASPAALANTAIRFIPPLASSTIAGYDMDESAWNGTAGEVIDGTGNGHDGTASGGVSTAASNPAIPGSPGTCGYALIPGNTTIAPPQAVDTGIDPRSVLGDRFTISLWHNFQNTAATSGWHTLFDATPAGSSDWFLLAHLGDQALFLIHNGAGFGFIFLNVPAINSNTWHYLTVTYDRFPRQMRLYVDGALVQQSTIPDGGLLPTQNLFLGDNVSGNTFLAGAADGLIDEARVYNRVLTATEIAAEMARVRPCPVLLDHFVISHDGNGISCLAEPVRVSAITTGGGVFSSYTGTISLDTGSGKGDWSLIGGNGVLNNGVANDGLASYSFAAGDNGVVVLALDYREGTSPVNIAVADGAATDDDSEGLLAFSPSGFTVTASTLPNPPPGVINDPIGTQTAGSNFALHITAYGQTPTDPVCGVIESYAGNRPLRFWSAYLDPGSGTVPVTIDGSGIATSEAAAGTRTVVFNQGQAQVTAKYKDVGRIRISMKDDSVPDPDLPNGIRGASNPFVVRPADFRLSAIRRSSDGFANPAAADQNGLVFIRAGSPFSVTVEALDAEGGVTPNYGRESSPEGVLLSPTLIAGGGTNNPPIQFTTGFGAFSAGIATGTDFSWGEVGIISLTASVADGDYLLSGDVTGTASGNVGRFIPFDFGISKNTPRFTTACAGFGYVGQPFRYATAPAITVTARNRAGGTTRNYTGDFWKLTDAKLTSSGNKTYSTASGTLDTGAVPTPDPVIVDSGNGTGTLGFSDGGGLAFLRGAPVAPFDAEIALSLSVIDEDDTAYAGNPISFGAASAGNGIAFTAGKQQRWGRLAMANAFGSELLPLPVPLRAEYFDGASFLGNSLDGCTTLGIGDLVLSSAVEAGQTDGTVVINTGGGTTTASIANSPLAAGDAGLSLSTPVPSGTGDADIRVDLGAAGLPWLRFDWDGNGVHDNDPTARASFGIFQGGREFIYEREPWN